MHTLLTYTVSSVYVSVGKVMSQYRYSRNSYYANRQQSEAVGCCFVGIILALFGGLFYAIGRALPVVIRALYYTVAWPVLVFEIGWQRGGIWRILAVVFGIAFMVVYAHMIMAQKS